MKPSGYYVLDAINFNKPCCLLPAGTNATGPNDVLYYSVADFPPHRFPTREDAERAISRSSEHHSAPPDRWEVVPIAEFEDAEAMKARTKKQRDALKRAREERSDAGD